MRKLFIALFFVTSITLSSNADEMKGIIVYKNDTVTVTFDIPINVFTGDIHYRKVQKKVKFIDSSGKKQVLRPSDAKEIIFDYKGAKIRMVSVFKPNTDISQNVKIFLKIINDDYLKLYIYHYYQSGPGQYGGPSKAYLLQKGDSLLKWPKNVFFRKDMVEYFSDCKELAEKIENKEYKDDDIEEIVKFYNSKCIVK